MPPHDTDSSALGVPAALGGVTRFAGVAGRFLRRHLGRFTTPGMLKGLAFVLAAVAALVLFDEVRTSRLQARYLARTASRLTYHVDDGPSDGIRFPSDGPYDRRLGYTRLPEFVRRLNDAGFEVRSQARFSPRLLELADDGFYPAYHEKPLTGITIRDREGAIAYAAAFPERAYPAFDSIPDVIVRTLLFIENRELFDARHPMKNPVVEWDRLGKAAFDMAWYQVDRDHNVPGGSTLATQLEKYRHSPEGQTSSIREKLRQMASASLRVYLDGENTLPARRRIFLDYVNSTPLAAVPGFGEVTGLGDGLWAWFGSEFDDTNRLLAGPDTSASPASRAERGLAYREVLALLLAARRPSFYLQESRERLESLTDTHLRVLADAGIIGPDLRDDAAGARLAFRGRVPVRPDVSFVERKAANAVRTRLLSLLGVSRFYDLDRLDLDVTSTLDLPAQRGITETLERLSEPAFAESAGVLGEKLLTRDGIAGVNYSFTLFEKRGDTNALLVQTDNFDQPFDLNEGAKLELGSTAKLRTLISYLEVVADLHARYAGLEPKALRAVGAAPTDHITDWAIDWLARAPDRSLEKMLDAAMERTYSASPMEDFFTGGGLHRFANFDKEDDGRVLSVRQALHRSVNLVFVRLMRDVVRHYSFRTEGYSARMLEDRKDPHRQAVLARFADKEGREFLTRFHKKYQDAESEEVLEVLLQGVRPTKKRLATIYRTVAPDSGLADFSAFIVSRLPDVKLTAAEARELYDKYAPGAYDLADRGYLAGVHPLDLWLASYLRAHPGAGRDEVIEASSEERQKVYGWLFKTGRKHTQDRRIRTILEMEAFLEIHRRWQRLGYPFGSLVPSYATALGSSGDRPAALSELVGILMNDGVRLPTARVEELHFGAGTPYETVMSVGPREGEQVLLPEIARSVRKDLVGVVERGTAQRLRGAFVLSDGTAVPVGGKTGTGDNRHESYSAKGRLIASRVVNRVATFVFLIGDRHFGVISAYVPGPQAEKYGFTSMLPAQVLRVLAPRIIPLIERSAPPAELAAASPATAP